MNAATSTSWSDGSGGAQASGGVCYLHLCPGNIPTAKHADKAYAALNSVVVEGSRNLDALELAGWRVGMTGGRHKDARFAASSGFCETGTIRGERNGVYFRHASTFKRKAASGTGSVAV